MEKRKYSITGMTCSACSAHVEKAARKVAGVKDVSVSLLTNSMTVSGNSLNDDEICSAVRNAGYDADPVVKRGDVTTKRNQGSEFTMTRLLMSLVFLLPLMYISMGHMAGLPLPSFLSGNPAATAMTEMILAAVVMIINQRFFISGFKGLISLAPNMDTLVSMGSGAAFIYSTAMLFRMTADPDWAAGAIHGLYFESSAMILTLISVGKMLEAITKGKTTDAIKRLADLTPKTARVIRDGTETEIPADELMAGELFTVRPGESIPADGTVTEGESAVNESALTGESLPVDKTTGSKVSAATINLNGFLVCRATQVGQDTTLSKIIELVENAASSKAPVAKLADKVSAIFVPSVIAIAAATLIVWLFAGREFGFALARAISVLVISCPCALGLATPVAVMVGSGIGAKNGILFKTAASLEAAGRTQIAVLDKTGTVTEGRPEVTDVITFSYDKDDLVKTAAALENRSEHPIARAIIKYAEEHDIIPYASDDFTALPGHGVAGTVKGRKVLGGNLSMIRNTGTDTSAAERTAEGLAESGKTPVYFASDGILIGIIAVSDAVKAESKEAVRELKDMGIRTVMLTGDNKATAKTVSEATDMEAFVADVLPDGKEAVIRELSGSGKVAMVGDGINDAPALTRADTGIAVGAGTDIASDAADIVLMGSGIKDVPAAIRLSRQVLRNIKENLFWAFFYNVLCIPLAAGVFIPIAGLEMNPMLGAAAMSLSSLFVVSNALRLNLFDIRKPNKKSRNRPVELPKIANNDAGHESINNDNTISEVKEMKKTVYIEGMMCSHCAAHVKKALEALDGITETSVDLENKNARITLEKNVDDDIIGKAVKDAGYEVIKIV